jgi:hypothetical protein
MPESPRYAVEARSLQGCQIRLKFHYQELLQEKDPIVRANIARALSEAAIDLAELEVSIPIPGGCANDQAVA